VYHFPNDLKTLGESFDFMLGPYLLVANVYKKGKTARKIYLPKSASTDNNRTTGEMGWYNWFSSGEYYGSGQVVVLKAELSQIPLLAREGML
jgi:alpha-glucosidase